MAIDHKLFLEDIMTVVAENESDDAAEPMDLIVRIVDDYKSELLLEKTNKESAEAMESLNSTVEDTDEDDSEYVAIKRPSNNTGALSQRAFLLEKAKQEYYKKLGLTVDDEAGFSILEKNAHRQKINELFYKLMLNEEDKTNETGVATTPFLARGMVRRAGNDDEEDEEDSEHLGAVEAKWKTQQKRRLSRKIGDIKGEITILKDQNAVPRISQSIVSRNEERIEELEDELEDLEQKLAQY